MRHRIARLALVPALAVACAAPGVAAATARTVSPVGFTSTGDAISGWQWLRSPGQTATWTFDAAALPSSARSTAALNVAALVTNGVNGGSGYDATVKFRVGSAGVQPGIGGSVSVQLVNPFRPVDPADSGGIGYQAYGHSTAVLPRLPTTGTFTVTLTTQFSPRTRHVAVRRDSLSIGYSLTVVSAPRR